MTNYCESCSSEDIEDGEILCKPCDEWMDKNEINDLNDLT